VPSYLVETYLAGTDPRERAAHEQRARSVADRLSADGTNVRFDLSIHVPADDVCFLVFEAPSSLAVAAAAEQAGLQPVRIVAAFTSRREVTKSPGDR
jgi:hypothetical protein